MKTPTIDTRDNGDGDRDEILRALRYWFGDGGIILELRALRCQKGGTVSGYFDGKNLPAMVDAAEYWSGRCEAVYILLNPACPDLLRAQ